MSIYGELDPMAEHRTSQVFDGMREHMVKVNIEIHMDIGEHMVKSTSKYLMV